MKAKVLLNPYANRWNAQSRLPQIVSALQENGLDFELTVSQSADDLREQARRAALDGFSPIIIGGGDGTLGTALNGLAAAWGDDAATWGPIGILPLGTANDLADNIGLPTDLDLAVQAIVSGTPRLLDVCRVNDRYFINNTALGLEARIAWRQNRMKWARGIWRYFAAALAEFVVFPSWVAEISWDDGQWQGPISLISIGNGRRTGGIYYTVPDADPFDGYLTFAVTRAASRLRMASLLRQVMEAERSYADAPEVFQHHTRFLRIDLNVPSPSHADGEIFTEAETHFEYQVLPGKLAVLMP